MTSRETSKARTPAQAEVTSDWSFQDFYNYLITSKPQTVHAMVTSSQLPQEYRRRFTLMYDSLSIQDASYEWPRVISYGETAKFVFTFNGHPQQKGFYNLETAEYNSETRRIYFREIVSLADWQTYLRATNQTSSIPRTPKPGDAFFEQFGLSANDIQPFNKAGDLIQNGIFITKPNPMKCMQCHAISVKEFEVAGSKPHSERIARYIWGNYARWNGAYGSRDDALNLKNEEVEAVEFIRLKFQSANNQNRYSHLNWGQHLFSPYSANAQGTSRDGTILLSDILKKLSPEEREYAASFKTIQPKEIDAGDYNFEHRPNTILTILLNYNYLEMLNGLYHMSNKVEAVIKDELCNFFSKNRSVPLSWAYLIIDEIRQQKILPDRHESLDGPTGSSRGMISSNVGLYPRFGNGDPMLIFFLGTVVVDEKLKTNEWNFEPNTKARDPNEYSGISAPMIKRLLQYSSEAPELPVPSADQLAGLCHR